MDMHDRLKKARFALGLTQKEMAEKIGLKGATLSDIERGKIKILSPRNLMLLSSVLGVSPVWLRTGEGGMFERSSLDVLAVENGLTDLELEILRLYMRLDKNVRQDILNVLLRAVTGEKPFSHAKTKNNTEFSDELNAMEYFDKQSGKPITPGRNEKRTAHAKVSRLFSNSYTDSK